MAISREADRSSGDKAFDVDVRMGVGRVSSFEITVKHNGETWLVHSKLSAGRFPDYKAVASAIAEYVTSGKHGEGWTRVEA